MKREDVVLMVQILQAMKELTEKLEKNYKDKDVSGMNKTKKEIIQIQGRLKEIL